LNLCSIYDKILLGVKKLEKQKTSLGLWLQVRMKIFKVIQLFDSLNKEEADIMQGKVKWFNAEKRFWFY
jgi:hypothetical protein